MMKKQLLLLVMMLLPMVAMAYDIAVANSDGVMIYYNYIKDTNNEVAVTYKDSNSSGHINDYNGDVVIPNTIINMGQLLTVSKIGYNAFACSQGLTTVVIPNSVKTIEPFAFEDCPGLTSIIIPRSVTSIGWGIFRNSTSLISIKVDSDNICYDSRDNCNAIIETQTNKLITGCQSTKIPNSVTSIENSAFNGCSGLKSINIPNSITSIGVFAFRGCAGLTSISIPNSITAIRDYTFADCSNLISIELPNSLTKIEQYAFSGCKSLTSFDIPFGVNFVGSFLFEKCTSLTSVSIPNSVTYIPSWAFYGCSRLSSIDIPYSVTSIGDFAFADCTSLISIKIPYSVSRISSMNPLDGCSGLTNIEVEKSNPKYDSRDKCNAIIEKSTNKLLSGCKNTIIPNSVTSIGEMAFAGSTGLVSITIPNSVTSIKQNAFWKCSGLTTISISESLNNIGHYAFSGCNNIKDFYCYAETVPTTTTDAFNDSYIDYATLHVPAASIEVYKAAEPWKNFKEIVALTDGDPKPSGIGKIVASDINNKEVYFDLNGQRIQSSRKGLNIVKMSDGKTKKVIVK